MSSRLCSYPITEDWPYSSGGGSSYNIFASEPPSSDPAFELYGEEGHSEKERDTMTFDEPPSSEWDYFEEDPDEEEKAILGDIQGDEDDFGEADPLSDIEYLDLFGELPPELNRIMSDDCSSVSSHGSGGAEGELVIEQDDDIGEEFRPNQPAALRADVLRREFDWQHFAWPCTHYGRNPTLKNGQPSACLKHRTMSDASLELMAFLNEFWTNPLEDRNGVLHPMPLPLQALKLADLPYICKIMVHTNFAFSRSSNLQFAHLDGTVSIYHSRRALSRHDGLQQVLVEWSVDDASIERILDAWNWLIEHNPLYQDEEDIEHEQLPAVNLDILEEERAEPNFSFPWSVVAAAEAGPRAGDTEVQNLQVGMDRRGRAQYFRDPDLMVKAFPELFPFGRGGFSLWHHKKNLRTEGEAGVPILSLKDYVKY
ncbi:hypothetical protein BGZ81_000952 [Podila clonocystis]|nr:hypothetical protein BGZ81_000952 [Podila clonocystis]